MKKYLCGAAAMVLLATMLFGCGMRNVSDHPGGMITDPTTQSTSAYEHSTPTEMTPTHTTESFPGDFSTAGDDSPSMGTSQPSTAPSGGQR